MTQRQNDESINKIIAEFEEVQQKVSELMKRLHKARNIGWVPKVGEDYCFIHPDYEVDFALWDDRPVDRERFSNGNVFKTEEEAELEGERLAFIGELKRFTELGITYDLAKYILGREKNQKKQTK